MKSYLFLLMVCFAFVSCDDEEPRLCCTFPGDDISYGFSVTTEKGADLLAPETEGSYNTNQIKVFNLIDGELVLVNNLDSDAPKGFSIFEREEEYRIHLFFKGDGSMNPQGIVQWNEMDSDTLKLELVQQSEDVKRLLKIWYNNNVVWDEEAPTGNRFFEIVK